MNIKEWQRPVLVVAMAVVAVLLLVEWNKFQTARAPELDLETITSSAPTEEISSTVAETSEATDNPFPIIEDSPSTDQPLDNITQESTDPANISKLVEIYTDSLQVTIDTNGGEIVKVALPKHSRTLEQTDEPYILLNRTNSSTYKAKVGLMSYRYGPLDTLKPKPFVFSVDQSSYRLGSNEDELIVDFQSQISDSVKLTKRFTFTRNDYFIKIDLLVHNQGNSNLSSKVYSQIIRDSKEPAQTGPGFGIQSFFGAATTSDDELYKKYTFSDIRESDFNKDFGSSFTHQGGWIAMVQHYFVSAIIPDPNQDNEFFIRPLPDNDLTVMGYVGPRVDIPPGSTTTFSTGLYSGPKDIHRMEELAPNLDRTLDFSWLFFIAQPMYLFLLWIHSFVGNWGLAIILLVVCVKAILYYPSAAGYRSMAKMKVFAPKMQELKERFGDNRQKMSEEMMKLYKKEKVNPLGGCLPMLMQIPVFISLYWVILEAVDLRHAPFIFWIQDLSAQDPFFILPILYTITMFLQFKLNPSMGDPTQQKIMQMMPFMFGIMFAFFQSGLVLYWVVNAMLGILQQWYITKNIQKAQNAKKA